MKWSVKGLIRLKPFDEAEESELADEKFRDSAIFMPIYFLMLLAVSLAIFGVALAVSKPEHTAECISLSMGLFALVAGMEWHAGLKSRALNDLFAAVLLSIVLFVIA